MGQFVEENAHLKTDLKKFQENFDSIDWGNLKEKPIDHEKAKKAKAHVTRGMCGEIGLSTFDEKQFKENFDHIDWSKKAE